MSQAGSGRLGGAVPGGRNGGGGQLGRVRARTQLADTLTRERGFARYMIEPHVLPAGAQLHPQRAVIRDMVPYVLVEDAIAYLRD